MKVHVQNQIRHDREGFASLARLYAETEHCFLIDIEFDMQFTTWLDADMCAAFGAMLYRLGDNLNSVEITNISPNVKRILSKNRFLSYYGGEKISNAWSTTIPYKRFEIEDGRYFANYIEHQFIDHPEFPQMSTGLLKRFRESIFEIFSNAVIHSRTQLGVFSCGQYFPRKERLAFSVADLGVGMQENVQNHLQMDIQPEEAIDWATRDNNTTKQANIPGGLGLKLLREFIDLNNGCLQIVSDAGYWCRRSQQTTMDRLDHPFPGTVVNVEIDVADQSFYVLNSELTTDGIF